MCRASMMTRGRRKSREPREQVGMDLEHFRVVANTCLGKLSEAAQLLEGNACANLSLDDSVNLYWRRSVSEGVQQNQQENEHMKSSFLQYQVTHIALNSSNDTYL